MIKKKTVTIEDLAGMVQRGFLDMREEFKDVHKRLDNIEILLIEDDRRRIERLEDAMKNVNELLAIK